MSYLTYRCFRQLQSQVVGLHAKRSFARGSELVEVSFNETTKISTVTLNRPSVNSLNLELLQQIGDTIDKLEQEKCRGMILTSALPTVFSAGLDLTEIYKPDLPRLKTFWTALQDMWLKLYGSSFQTVSAISGHSPAGGCLIALSCDYRIMVTSQKYTIGLNETKVGITVPKFVELTMLNVIGRRQTEIALTSGRMFSVSDALQVGLIDETASDKADTIKKAEMYLDKYQSMDLSATSRTKRCVRQSSLDWLIKNKENDLKFYVEWFQNPEVQGNVKMILENLEKRKK